MQDGRCKTLDAGADGYMRGEACVVHLLEAFEPAELAACHMAHGALILHGTAVNQDGRSSSLTVHHLLCSFLNALFLRASCITSVLRSNNDHILHTCLEPPEAHWSQQQSVTVQLHTTPI